MDRADSARSNEPTFVDRGEIPDERDAIKAKFCVIGRPQINHLTLLSAIIGPRRVPVYNLMAESCSTPSTWPTSSSEALSIDEHDQSCAHFKRRVGSLDGLDDRGARLTYAYTRSCSSIPCARELILDYLEGVEHDSAIRVEPGVRHGAIRAHFTRKCHFGRVVW